MSETDPKPAETEDDEPDPERLNRFGWGDDDLEIEDDEKE